jgi:hypothetical protein
VAHLVLQAVLPRGEKDRPTLIACLITHSVPLVAIRRSTQPQGQSTTGGGMGLAQIPMGGLYNNPFSATTSSAGNKQGSGGSNTLQGTSALDCRLAPPAFSSASTVCVLTRFVSVRF